MSEEIKCSHLDRAKTVYVYKMGEETELHVCEKCNMNLAGEIMKQLATETFINGVKDDE